MINDYTGIHVHMHTLVDLVATRQVNGQMIISTNYSSVEIEQCMAVMELHSVSLRLLILILSHVQCIFSKGLL